MITRFNESVFVTFQVLRVIKTRQATYSVLKHLIDYVENLEKVGLLEKKEMLHLHDSVQVTLCDIFTINSYCLLGILP